MHFKSCVPNGILRSSLSVILEALAFGRALNHVKIADGNEEVSDGKIEAGNEKSTYLKHWQVRSEMRDRRVERICNSLKDLHERDFSGL